MMTDSYIPQVSGLVTSIVLFRKELERLGHEIFIIAPVGPDDDPRCMKVKGLRFLTEKQHKIAIPNLKSIHQFLQDNKVTHLHSHAPFSMGFAAMQLQKKYGYVHIHTYHTLLVEYRHYIPKPFTPSRQTISEFSRWFCNQMDGVFAPTTEIQDELAQYGVHKRIWVIPTGIDTYAFEGVATLSLKQSFGLPEDAVVGLYAGRLGVEKNVEFLIRTTESIVRRGFPFYLIIVGDGPNRKPLEEMVQEKGLAHRIHFTGYMNRKQLIEYYKAADLFLFASTTETQGLVVLEAMAAGTPVVAIAQKGVKNVLLQGQGCLLIPRPDEQSFRQNVELLIQDEQVRRYLSGLGKDYVQQFWSMEKSAKQAENVYGELERDPNYVPQKIFTMSRFITAISRKLSDIEKSLFE